MGKRFNGEWKYYKFKKENETIIRFTDSIRYFENQGYSYEVLKPKRYDDETLKRIVKEVLTNCGQLLHLEYEIKELKPRYGD